ncbi:hypothetical protein [Rathayibacter soli]|uniref:hypothetical protein n=1 Tax=Rathayibacter soli TaxID=3144168 RepID=UPI0027E3DCA9|nr:hypothetical protein [Glaciibacter superstes]
MSAANTRIETRIETQMVQREVRVSIRQLASLAGYSTSGAGRVACASTPGGRVAHERSEYAYRDPYETRMVQREVRVSIRQLASLAGYSTSGVGRVVQRINQR